MIVIGGKNSANTTHLAEILKDCTKTIHIENDDEISKETRDVFSSEKFMENLIVILKDLQMKLAYPKADAEKEVSQKILNLEEKIRIGKDAGTISKDEEYYLMKTLEVMREEEKHLIESNLKDGKEAFDLIRKDFTELTKRLSTLSEDVKNKLSNLFKFL